MNQVLTQDEINALLRGLSDGDVETDTFENSQQGGIRKYDLASQVLKSSQTFKIATLTTNEKLNDELFNHTPKEGMTIVQSKNAEVFQVAADGSLVPFTPSQGVHRRWFILSGLVIFASILAIFVIRRSHRKSRDVA